MANFIKTPQIISSTRILPWVIIPALGFLIYSNTFYGEFVSDDSLFIFKNIAIRNIGNIRAIWEVFNTRFLVGVSFAFNYWIGKLDVFGYHLFNVSIHILNSLLVYNLVLWTFKTPAMRDDPLQPHVRSIALFSSLIFLCHPIQTQAVSYIFQRLVSMATLFYLGTIIFYIKAKLESNPVYLGMALGTMCLGVLCKEMTVTIPLALFAYEYFFMAKGKKIDWRVGKHLIPFFVPVFALLAIFFLTHGNTELGLKEQFLSKGFSGKYFLTEINVLRTYLRLLFLPIHQNHSYDYPLSRGLWEIPTILSFCLLIAVLISAIFWFPRKRLLSFCVIWFFIATSVELVVVCFVHKGVIYEHWLYLAMVGFSIFLSASIYSIFKTNARSVIVAVAIVSSFCIMTYERNNVWKNSVVLWKDTIKKSPQDALPYDNLGAAYLDRGEHDLAYQYLQKAADLDPNECETYINLGILYQNTGRIDQARKSFDAAIKISPGGKRTALAYNDRGVLLYESGEFEKAETDFMRAIELRPYLLEPYLNLASLYRKRGRIEEAIVLYKRIIEKVPSEENSLFFLVELYLGEGERTKMLSVVKDILRKSGNSKKLTSLGSLLADRNFGNMALAVFSQAIKKDPKNKDAYLELGKLYGNQGKFDEAIAIWQEGLRLDPADQRFQEYIARARDFMKAKSEKQ